MPDPRIQKLAQVLVHYSLELKSGDRFRLNGTVATAPLIREVYREAVRAGVHVTPRIELTDLNEIFFREANEDQLNFFPDLLAREIEYFDAVLSIGGDENTKYLSGIDPKRMAVRGKVNSPINQRFMERAGAGELRWCFTRFPTQAHAQDAGMSLSDYEEFVYSAELLNEPDPVAGWRKVHDEQQHIIEFLEAHDEIHITAPGTDVRYSVGGRTWINADGQKNFPDGEVFSAPVEDSVNGVVSFSYPAIFQGNEVEGIRLTFEEGKVVEGTATKGQELLNTMLDMDAGARYLGEVAFGLNYNIQRFSRDILFDEKIGGTMHMAIGRAYPETGGKNQSGLHWDMICDLHGGEVYADGELCYKDGKFTL
jgi:aminopeptidase